jgi:hypothetical protein
MAKDRNRRVARSAARTTRMITGAASSVARYVTINRASRTADLSVVIKEGASDIIQRAICGTPTCSMNLTLVGYRTSLQAHGGNSGTKGQTRGHSRQRRNVGKLARAQKLRHHSLMM